MAINETLNSKRSPRETIRKVASFLAGMGRALVGAAHAPAAPNPIDEVKAKAKAREARTRALIAEMPRRQELGDKYQAWLSTNKLTPRPETKLRGWWEGYEVNISSLPAGTWVKKGPVTTLYRMVQTLDANGGRSLVEQTTFSNHVATGLEVNRQFGDFDNNGYFVAISNPDEVLPQSESGLLPLGTPEDPGSTLGALADLSNICRQISETSQGWGVYQNH